ncbi:MAG: 4Fe-4S dicluster domain-containing protein [Candidatus Moduliflexus flocculans]|nr:4Fe-4S dicluster domain-containing protein [Candidatus Moduliflexus flocculans]
MSTGAGSAVIRYVVFGIWISFLILGFVMAGGIRGIDPLHVTELGISVDEPIKYITYYGVVGILFLLTVTIGRRGACHSLCWMSPFLQAGMWVGRKLRLPQFKVISEPSRCISCKKCDAACPMSIDVHEAMKSGKILSLRLHPLRQLRRRLSERRPLIRIKKS